MGVWRRTLSHTIHQPNIPDLGERCTNIRYLPNLSQRGAVPSWTHRELLQNFGRVSFSTLLWIFAVPQSSLPTGPVCKRCCYHVALKVENPLSSPDLLKIRHSAFPHLPSDRLQPGQSIVLTIPGTTAAHGNEVLFVPGSCAKSLQCKMNSVWPLAVLGMKEPIKPEPLWRCNGEKERVGEVKARERVSLPYVVITS